NLSINARDAMPDGGTLTIATTLDPHNDGRVIVSVSDTGTGMSPEVVARAFDPFFTTKPPGKGTGLGLSQVYGIVRQIGGEVSIETAPGKGTTIRLALPLTDADAHSAGADERAVTTRHSEKLLVVDDDPDVRDVVTGVLSDIGYEVHEAADGDSAL